MYIEDPKITYSRNLNRITELYREVNHCSKGEFYRRLKRAGINSMTFDYYLRGWRWPDPDKMKKVAEFFELPVELFFRI